MKLRPGNEPISDARWGMHPGEVDHAGDFLRAVSFTETPVSEVHCLLEIENRRIELAPYGLVFLKRTPFQKRRGAGALSQ